MEAIGNVHKNREGLFMGMKLDPETENAMLHNFSLLKNLPEILPLFRHDLNYPEDELDQIIPFIEEDYDEQLDISDVPEIIDPHTETPTDSEDVQPPLLDNYLDYYDEDLPL